MPIVDYGHTKAFIDGYLKSNLDIFKSGLKKNFDIVFIVTGREGFGKSVFTAQILRYLDPTFNIDRCYFSGDEFIDALIDAEEPYQAYMFDEGQEFTSRAALSRFNKRLVDVLSKIRAKRLIIGICIPSFFELDRNAAVHRSNFLLQVYLHKGIRGFFKFYSYDRKRDLYMKGKKTLDYNVLGANFFGRFTDKAFPFDRNEYDKKKFLSMKSLANEDGKNVTLATKTRDVLIKWLHKLGKTPEDVEKHLRDREILLKATTIEKIMGYKDPII